jgi:hypothetical protein
MNDLVREQRAEAVENGTSKGGERALPGMIRKLWVGETSAFRDHLLRLDPESRRTRFGSPVNNFFIGQYA